MKRTYNLFYNITSKFQLQILDFNFERVVYIFKRVFWFEMTGVKINFFKFTM